MERFFVDPEALKGETAQLDRQVSHRLRHVLRLHPGDRVILLDGRGGEYETVLEEADGPATKVAIVGRREGLAEPRVGVVLYQSIVKGDRFDWVLEKGTELGVAKFVPLVSSRGVVRPRAGRVERMERWRRIVREAAEQCGRSRVPEVGAPVSLSQVLTSSEGLRLLPWEGERQSTLRQALKEASQGEEPKVVSIFIGPEGGFAREEVERAVEVGVRTVSLGRRILRSETAGIVASAMVLFEFGDLGE
jgi:16S rRNA (uracil1498-N3)-methyltransferase